VLGLDDSQPSDAALELVCALPPEDRTAVLLYSAAPNPMVLGGREYYEAVKDELHEQCEHVVETALAVARARGVAAEERIVDGNADDALIAGAHEDRADLIVVGSHGRRGVSRFVLGSVAESVVRRAPMPVLVVRTVPKPAPAKVSNKQAAAQR